MSATDRPVVSTIVAPSAVVSGDAARPESAASRAAIDARTSSIDTVRSACASSRWRRRARSSSEAVRNTFTAASGNTTEPMSRPSTTPPPCSATQARWRATSSTRTRRVGRDRRHGAGDLGTADLRRHVVAVERGHAVVHRDASPPRAAPAAASASAGSSPARSTASVTARYIAPVSSVSRPSAVATPRPIVDFPDPDGPSIATTRAGTRHASTDSRSDGEPRVRHRGRPEPTDRRLPTRTEPGDGRGHRDPVVAVALEGRTHGRAALDDPAVGARLDRDPELGELLLDGPDAVALLHRELGRVVDDGLAVGERGRDREHRQLVDDRLVARDVGAVERRGGDVDVADRLADLLAGDGRRRSSRPCCRRMSTYATRAGFRLTRSSVRSDPGTMHAATTKNAADDGSPGTSISNARGSPARDPHRRGRRVGPAATPSAREHPLGVVAARRRLHDLGRARRPGARRGPARSSPDRSRSRGRGARRGGHRRGP